MVKCSVMNCSGGSDRSVSSFSLPNKIECRQKWLDFLVQSGKEIKDCVHYQICEQHFISSDIKTWSPRKTLKNGAVPTILPEVSQ